MRRAGSDSRIDRHPHVDPPGYAHAATDGHVVPNPRLVRHAHAHAGHFYPNHHTACAFFTPVNKGFLTILLSGGAVYWNSGPCSPRSIKVTAFVSDIIHTDYVLLFMRPREKSDTMLLGDWSSVEMIPGENGRFLYEVGARNIRKYYWFIQAWVEYQLVAYDKDGVELFRSQVYDKTLSLIMCRPINP
jgi:hypothetical protein